MALILGGLVFSAAAAQAAALLAFVWGSLTSEIASFSIAAGGAAALIAWNRARSRLPQTERVTVAGAAGFLAVLFFCARYFFWIYYPEQGDWKVFEIIENRMPEFLSGLAALTGGEKFWPSNPYVLSERFHDFGMTLFAAAGVKCGLPLTSFLPVLTMLAAAATAALLIFWAQEVAAAVFLFWSGTAGLLIYLASRFEVFKEFLSQKTAFAGALPLMGFVSYPELWFALPAGLFLLWRWRARWRDSCGEDKDPDFGELLVWGALPLFHFHSFWILSAALAIQAFSAGQLRLFARAFGKALLLASPWILLNTGFLHDFSGVFQVSRKNLHYEGGNWAGVARKFGLIYPWLLAVLAGSWLRPQKMRFWGLAFPVSAAFIFLMYHDVSARVDSNLPWLLWCCVLLAHPLHEDVYRRFPVPGRVLILILLCAPGLLLHHQTYNGYFRNKKALVRSDEKAAVCRALESLSRSYRYATAMDTAHPAALCGYPVVSALNESHFADGSLAKQNAEKLRKLLSGAPEWRRLAEDLQVRYLFWGSREKQDFAAAGDLWERVVKKARDGEWGTVYDLGVPGPVGPQPQPGYGLRASFFNNKQCRAEPLMIKSLKSPEFKWKESEQEIVSTSFGILLEGQLYVPRAGDYIFYLASDDGSVLELDGKIVVDNGGDHGLRIKFAAAELEEGWHPLRITYHNDWGMAFLRLWWKPADGEEDRIPDAYFRQPAAAASSGADA